MRRVVQQVAQVRILQPALDEGESGVPPRCGEVCLFQRSRVVVGETGDADHVGAVGEELLDQMRADKAGGTRHERPHASTFRISAGSRVGRPSRSTTACEGELILVET